MHTYQISGQPKKIQKYFLSLSFNNAIHQPDNIE